MTDADRAPAWAPPLLAVQFITRVPVPALVRLGPSQVGDGLARAMAWLPLVGTAVGAFTAVIYLAALHFWPPAVAALVALMAEALLTGAFHEDAVADFCDALGGSARGDEARRIMRDSRIGSYGALGLGLCVALRWAVMVSLPSALAFAAIVGAATGGRLAAVALATLLAPAGDGAGMAQRAGRVPVRRLLLAALLSFAGVGWFAVTSPSAAALGIGGATLLLIWLNRMLARRIGGSTGDCLGFAAYATQLIFLLAAAAG